MNDTFKSVCFLGFGASNRALYEHLLPLGCDFFVHAKEPCTLENGICGVFGENYLYCPYDIIFRSPSVRPDSIVTSGAISSECKYAFEKITAPKICITGSDGKTTCSTLINRVLLTKYSSFLGGNIGNPLVNAIGLKHDFLVCELSSFQLMDFAPSCDVALITNITPNHLNWHKSMVEYKNAKLNILKNAKRRVLCYDDMELREHILPGYTTVFSLNDISSLDIDRVYLKNDYIYHCDKRLMHKSQILLRGSFNLLNVMASIACTYPYVDTNELVCALCSFTGVKNRCEFVKKLGDVSFFNSSIDTTPHRTIATLSAFDASNVVIILGGADKNLSYECLGSALSNVRYAVLLGQSKDKILPHLKCKSVVVNSLYEAVHCAYSLAKPSGVVLLSPACTSFDMFESYEHRGAEFIKLVTELCRTDFKKF